MIISVIHSLVPEILTEFLLKILSVKKDEGLELRKPTFQRQTETNWRLYSLSTVIVMCFQVQN